MRIITTVPWLAVHEDELAQVTADRDKWQTLYTTAAVRDALTAAAAEAFDASQVADLLERHAKLVDEGGRFAVKVAFGGSELTPQEAVERMRALPNYANLFRSAAAADPAPGNQVPTDPAAYRAWRKQQGLVGRK